MDCALLLSLTAFTSLVSPSTETSSPTCRPFRPHHNPLPAPMTATLNHQCTASSTHRTINGAVSSQSRNQFATRPRDCDQSYTSILHQWQTPRLPA